MFARVLDLETTGTPEDESPEVIEMACYDVPLTGTVLPCPGNWFQSLCRPRGPIPPTARAVHHISDDRLPPIKTCPACFRVWCSGQRIFLECGFEFYAKRQKEAEKNG